MNILVTNDDSIHAPGLALLAKAAMELGDVWVVAPAHQCSAMSQRLTIRGHLRVDKVEDFPVPVKGAFQVDGTPADCVKAALCGSLLPQRPDYVFSGINNGYNAGFDIAYSGTLGAAFEAVMNSIPAIAFSGAFQGPLTLAQLHLADIARKCMQAGQGRGEVWNVNFPGLEPDSFHGILWDRSIAPLGFYNGRYTETAQSGGSLILEIQGDPLREDPPVPEGTDIAAIQKGCISVGKVKCAVL